MKKLEFRPVFLGADIGIYSSARSFYEEYGVKSFAFCKHKLWTIANSKIIDYEIMRDIYRCCD
jgi:D-aspartate ligase